MQNMSGVKYFYMLRAASLGVEEAIKKEIFM